MSSPKHHIGDEMLFEYASGGSTEGEALFVAVHCALCPACRRRVEALHAVGGELLEELEEADLSTGAEAALLAALDHASPGHADVSPSGRRFDPDGVLPRPLVDLIGPFNELPWRFKVPGIQQVDVPVAHADTVPVQLFRLAPGLRIPMHQHVGLERTLVLAGGFTDNASQYERGDVAIYGENWDHKQVIDPGEPCISLVVNDGSLIPRTVLGSVVSWLMGNV